jgi:hypothetical protein
MENFRNILDEYAEGSVILDGFDDAIIGITEEFGRGPRILFPRIKYWIYCRKIWILWRR